MSVWETLETMIAGGPARSMPTLGEAAYRVNALREGNPVSGRGPGIGVPTVAGEDWLTAALDAVVPVPLGMVKPLTGRKSLIKDWRWKPESQVQQQLNLQDLPEHIEPFGQFMREQVGRAGKGLTPRDLLKSYGITRSSIQRQARDKSKVPAAIRWAAEGDTIRPEDAFSAWLFTPKGQDYLNAAERGAIDHAAIADAMAMIRPFGKDKDLGQALMWGARNLPGREGLQSKLISEAASGAKNENEWLKAIQDYSGIGAAKAGFYGSMLGYGRLPTLDARQLQVHTPDPKMVSKFGARGGGEGASQALMKLARRQENLDIGLPEGMEPFRQHLTHHAIWDTAANTESTHESIMRAMRNAGIGAFALTPALNQFLAEPNPYES